MDAEHPHCTICLKSLAAGWRCRKHQDLEKFPMDYNSRNINRSSSKRGRVNG